MKISQRYELDGGSFFAGANSAEGFVSFYGTVLGDATIEKVYIIKGGPGTGKSHFMKAAARMAEERALSVERYYCSSDPESLDAVIIGGKYAILDGTAPHAVEAECAGAREEIINLGAFWDSEKLFGRRDKIKELSGKKAESYKRAYSYLDSANKVKRINAHLMAPAFLEKKAMGAVGRIFEEMMTGGGYTRSCGVISSIGMKGKVRLDTYEHFADKVYLVDDFYGMGSRFLSLLAKKAVETDTPTRVSYLPISSCLPEEERELDAVFFPNDKTAFVLGRSSEKLCGGEKNSLINMRRFTDKALLGSLRGEYRLNEKICESLISSAEECLCEAGKYHFELEKLYEDCMDFGSKEVFCNNFLNNLLP